MLGSHQYHIDKLLQSAWGQKECCGCVTQHSGPKALAGNQPVIWRHENGPQRLREEKGILGRVMPQWSWASASLRRTHLVGDLQTGGAASPPIDPGFAHFPLLLSFTLSPRFTFNSRDFHKPLALSS